MNQLATTPKTLAEVQALPNKIEAKSMAAALESVRNFMRENYNYTGAIGYSKRFVENAKIVYVFYSQLTSTNHKVYVIF